MKGTKHSTANLEPELNQSNNIRRSRKSREYHSRDESIENERENPHAQSFTQDVIESSQPCVSKKKNRLDDCNSDRCIVERLTTEFLKPVSSGEAQFKTLSLNSSESCLEVRTKILGDYLSKSGEKKDRKRRRIPFFVYSESHSNRDYDIIVNEKPHYQIHVESNQSNHDKDRKKSKSKMEHRSSWDMSFPDFLSPVETQRTDDAETRPEMSKKDRKRKRKENVEKKIANTPPAMIPNSGSGSDDETQETNDCSIATLNKGNTRNHNKSRVSQILSTRVEEEESHSSNTKHFKKFIPNPNNDQTSDSAQPKGLENDKDCCQDYQQGFEFVKAITSEKLSADIASNHSSPNIPVDLKIQPDVIRKDRKHKSKENVEKKKANTFLTMIHDIRSSSDSDNEIKKIDDCSVQILNKKNTRKRNKSRVSQTSSTSDEVEEGNSSKTKGVKKFISSPTSNNASDNYRLENRESEKDFSRDEEQGFEFVGIMKSEKLPADAASNCTSLNISVEHVIIEPDVIGRYREHEAEGKVEKKKANTLLTMIHDIRSSSDSDNEIKKIDDCSVQTLNKKNTRKRNKSRVSQTSLTSDEVEEGNSSKTKGVKKFISSPTSNNASDNYRLENRESEKDFSRDEEQGFEFVGIMKSEKLPADAASNCTSLNISVEHVIEPDVIGRYREHEAEGKVEKKKANTLLTMIHDIRSSSDLDDGIKNDDSSKESVDKPNSRKSTKSRVSGRFEKEEEDEGSSEQPVRNPSVISRKFDLEAEAEDIEELISAIEEKEQIPIETVTRSLELHVRLKHTVPPQHQIETSAGSRGPTPRQKKMIEKFGPIKYGKFAPGEDDIIVNNWKSFCELHDWDPSDVKPFLYIRHRKVGLIAKLSERHKFVQFLADGLPWRTLYSVYWRFRNLYQPHIRTKYTVDEDKLIIAHMENSSAKKNVRKFSELGKILNRTRASVWRRYRLIKKRRNPHEKLEWSLHLVKKVIKNLIKLTLSHDVCQLKDLDIPLVVWNKLSKKLKIDNKELKQFWLGKLHMQLFCQEPVYLNDVKIKLIEYFHATGISESWEIEWPSVAKNFDGMTTAFLSPIFGRLVCNEKYKAMEFGEIIGHLYEVKKPELQKSRNDKCLPRIVFKDGNVKLLDVKADNRSKRKTVES